MVSDHLENPFPSVSVSQEHLFAGDGVRLAGQIDYPTAKKPPSGHPLLFVLQHATCNSRKGYLHVTKLGTETGAAVFRWDKRGTGSSGSGSTGSTTVDAINAYEKAVSLPNVDPQRVIIFAQNEGSLLLKEAFKQFQTIQQPAGVVLAGNMLDDEAIVTIKAPVHIVVSKNDWNAWQIYAEKAADVHATATGYNASFYVATNTNRRLMYTNGDTFHRGAEESIKYWLKHTCQIST